MSHAGDTSAPDGPTIRAFVASKLGITRIEVAGDEVRGYALVEECTATDVTATADGRIAVATPQGVLLGDGEEFEASGFGAAVAVGGDPLMAASPKGHVGKLVDGEWERIASLGADVAAIDGDLIATDEGVFRVTADGVEHVGLDRATDVATAGVPHAAAQTGLYKLGAGWMKVADGPFDLVVTDATTVEAGVLRRAHAATPDQLYVYDGEEWGPWHIPVASPVVGIGYAEAVYAVSEDGTLISAKEGEWRTRSLGLSGVTGLVVQPLPETEDGTDEDDDGSREDDDGSQEDGDLSHGDNDGSDDDDTADPSGESEDTPMGDDEALLSQGERKRDDGEPDTPADADEPVEENA
jgi:hypothetical protein